MHRCIRGSTGCPWLPWTTNRRVRVQTRSNTAARKAAKEIQNGWRSFTCSPAVRRGFVVVGRVDVDARRHQKVTGIRLLRVHQFSGCLCCDPQPAGTVWASRFVAEILRPAPFGPEVANGPLLATSCVYWRVSTGTASAYAGSLGKRAGWPVFGEKPEFRRLAVFGAGGFSSCAQGCLRRFTQID